MKKDQLIYVNSGIHGYQEYRMAGRWNGDVVLEATAKDDENILIYTDEEIEEGLADEWLCYTETGH